MNNMENGEKQKYYSGVMIALMLPENEAQQLKALVPDNVEPVDDLHVTLVYVGDSETQSIDKGILQEVVSEVAQKQYALGGNVNGLGRFAKVEEDGTNAVYASYDAYGLDGLRSALVNTLEERGIEFSKEHGFTPHITLCYVDKDSGVDVVIPDNTPLDFDTLTLSYAMERYDYPLLEQKAGKRVRSNKVSLLQQVMEALQENIVALAEVLQWAKYEDSDKQATRGDIERSRRLRQQAKPAAGDGAGKAKWTAKVGETIIGNLARGEGGRFVSASNITSMMGMLDRANINPQMFEGLQAISAGEEVANEEALSQLKAAGLVTDEGLLSGKANDILNAIKTGEPDNLKAVVKPKAKSKEGRGKKPEKEPKPTKAEIEKANVEKLKQQIVLNDRLSEEEVNALVDFANGEDVSKELLEDLQDGGLTDIDSEGFFRLTDDGEDVIEDMQKGNLRSALDTLSEAKDKRKAQQKEIAENIDKTSESLVKNAVLSQEDMDAFLQFGEGLESDALNELDATGLVKEGAFTVAGNRFIDAVQQGDLESAQSIFNRAANDINTDVIETTKAELAQAANLDADLLDAFLEFSTGADVDSETLNALVDNNLIEKSNNKFSLNADSQSVLTALRNGDFRQALGIVTETKAIAFKTYTGEDGKTWIMTLSMNSYRDRELEYFRLKGIQEYVERNLDNESKGVYMFWHIPGTEFGTIHWQGVIGKFLVELGTFDDTPIGNAFKEFFLSDYAKNIAWGCSPGYVYQRFDREDGIYEWFDKRETSILPLAEAANIFTNAEVV